MIFVVVVVVIHIVGGSILAPIDAFVVVVVIGVGVVVVIGVGDFVKYREIRLKNAN